MGYQLDTFETDPCLVQGSKAWLELRKTKITATDAAVCMGLNPWCKLMQRYEEKLGLCPPPFQNAAMARGVAYEEEARQCFEKLADIQVYPRVIVRDWQMASLDGIDFDDTCVVEIKVGGKKLHDLAKKGVVPVYYRCQVQHQIDLAGVDYAYFFSYRPAVFEINPFNGKFTGVVLEEAEGIIVPVERNDTFIKEMTMAEWAFYECLITKTPPREAVLI